MQRILPHVSRMGTCILVVLVIFACSGTGLAQGSAKQGFRKFEGAWFDILYPRDFKVRISLFSNSSGEKKAESAFFTSPDGTVEFYIFSPQWSGDPRDIALNPATEVLGDRTKSTKNGETTTMYTIKAKDGSYMRSYRDVTTESTRYVIGIKYKSKAAYNAHKARYIKFRDSLVQYADGWDGEE